MRFDDADRLPGLRKRRTSSRPCLSTRSACRRNLDSTRGLIFSGQLLLDLVEHGFPAKTRTAWCSATLLRAWKEDLDFHQLVLNDKEITTRVPAKQIERAFDLRRQLKNVDRYLRGCSRTAENARPPTALRDRRSLNGRCLPAYSLFCLFSTLISWNCRSRFRASGIECLVLSAPVGMDRTEEQFP